MEKIYVLAHASHRFRDDFFPCGTHVEKPPCRACGGNLNELVDPLLYFWDFEFGDPQFSVNAGHHCFWGQFQLMIDQRGRAILESLDLPFSFSRTKLAEGRDVVGLSGSRYWATPFTTAEADPIASKNAICRQCGEFTERRRAIARLRIARSNFPPGGVFLVTQNGAWSPTFVTERTRAALAKANLEGLGFYPAGRIV
jgi:hypothetical protein